MSIDERIKKLMKENGLDERNENLFLTMKIFYIHGQADLLREQLNKQEK